MRRFAGAHWIAAAAAAVLIPLTVATAAPPRDDCSGAIKPAPVMPVLECDGMDRILEKAAGIVPRPPQVAWQRHEITAFTHFGMNTFTDREWGSGTVSNSATPSWCLLTCTKYFAPPAGTGAAMHRG
jgi:alpha-L-fucosidase